MLTIAAGSSALESGEPRAVFGVELGCVAGLRLQVGTVRRSFPAVVIDHPLEPAQVEKTWATLSRILQPLPLGRRDGNGKQTLRNGSKALANRSSGWYQTTQSLLSAILSQLQTPLKQSISYSDRPLSTNEADDGGDHGLPTQICLRSKCWRALEPRRRSNELLGRY